MIPQICSAFFSIIVVILHTCIYWLRLLCINLVIIVTDNDGDIALVGPIRNYHELNWFKEFQPNEFYFSRTAEKVDMADYNYAKIVKIVV